MISTPLANVIRSRGLKFVELAKLAGVDKAAISRWVRGKIPAERVLPLEKATGIPRHELRPDLYPPEEAQPERSVA
jgi:DNA-binding transcriptional regulator YdaS (Cro superfamily)